jgi:hypothetical protein
VLSSATPTKAKPGPHWCECVEYIKNRFGLTGAAGDAKDMGPFLAKNGFKRSAIPIPGGVVIIQPGFYPSGSGAVYGHAALIQSIYPAGKYAWRLTLVAANQSGAKFTAADCTDVSIKDFAPIPWTSKMFSYWAPPPR